MSEKKKGKVNERRYKVPRWVENRKATHAKNRGILLGWEPRQKLGIIPKGEKGFLQRSLLPSYERHPNHWGSLPRSSLPGYLSLAHKLSCTSEGPHNMSFEPRNTLQEHTSKTCGEYERGLSPLGRAKPEKYSKTNLRLSLPKTHHLFAVAARTPNITCSKEGKSPPMVGKMR